MNDTPQKFRVMGWCCRSAMCFDCKGEGVLARRKRRVIANNLTAEQAKRYAAGWSNYDARVEVMR